MEGHKLHTSSFDAGSRFHHELTRQMNRAGIRETGRARILDAMKAATEHVAKRNDLRLGVGGNHYDEIEHFLTEKYRDWRHMNPKEREFVTSSLQKHYGIEVAANDNAGKAAHMPEPPAHMPIVHDRFAPSPKPANDDELEQAA